MNRHGQKVTAKLRTPGNHPSSKLWALECTHCGHEYGANSCDAHERRCPKCQQPSRPGLPLKAVKVAALAVLFLLTFNPDVKAVEIDEDAKIAALKLAYKLNGNSMVNWGGSFDLTNYNFMPPPPDEPTKPAIRTIPIEPQKKDRK